MYLQRTNTNKPVVVSRSFNTQSLDLAAPHDSTLNTAFTLAGNCQNASESNIDVVIVYKYSLLHIRHIALKYCYRSLRLIIIENPA